MGQEGTVNDADLVRYSAAGTAFHYRWAARRCLKLIEPRSPVRMITVEASRERNHGGECVIDLGEYEQVAQGVGAAAYYQLKHSTVRTAQDLVFADAKKTIGGFAARFRDAGKGKKDHKAKAVSFKLVTNRRVSTKLKNNIQAIRDGAATPPRFRKALEEATKLKGENLRAFCAAFSFVDGQGDYIAQKRMLHGEMAECIAGFDSESPEIESLIALVADRALPESENRRRVNGEIYPADVLQRLGASGRGLFPAQPEFGKLPKVFERKEQASLLQDILNNPGATIIHAEGGVGKTIVARQLAASLPDGSHAIVYDCFGSGKYRNESSPRHRACDGLVQMANELAASGYSGVLIGDQHSASDELFRKFLERLGQATDSLKQLDPKALLVLIVDAGDNAEMAAKDRGDSSFVKLLLWENLPSSCRLVVLCRTERLNLLDPPSTAELRVLSPFSKAETAVHLGGAFPEASDQQAEEFHRLTGGNPRVQANALNQGAKSLLAILRELGPSPTTVGDQIARQLKTAIAKIRDASPGILKANLDAICTGLATLPPLVPLEVLATVAKVDVAAIKSFVSDLGRPLWHSDDSVQFLDEPTETWFRKEFSANSYQLNAFVKALEPLAAKYTYVAKALPKLLLQSNKLEKLVTLALSDQFLPQGKPIDERDVRVYRLRFAFRAALKMGRLADAVRLALRAGEEVAGDQRQLEMLAGNLDLIAPLQDQQRVQELALSRTFSSGWPGSENLFCASLLSSVPDFKGEARSFLRVAEQWLHIHFENRKKAEDSSRDDSLTRKDILEFVWAHYNLRGPAAAAQYLLGWRPPDLVFDIGCRMASRLVDAGLFDDLDTMARVGMKNPYFMIALAEETSSGLHSLPRQALEGALDAFLRKKTRIPKGDGARSRWPYAYAIVSFAEACAARRLPRKKILSLLRHYTSPIADRSVGDDTTGTPRRTFVRAASLSAVLSRSFTLDSSKMIPPSDPKAKRDLDDQQWVKDIIESIEVLLPWYLLRARLLCHHHGADAVVLDTVHQQSRSARHKRAYRSFDQMPFEASRAWFEVLALKQNVTPTDLNDFTKNVIKPAERKFTLRDRLEALRASHRISHLRALQDELELSCRTTIELPGSRPEEDSRYYIELARALLTASPDDAAAYFGNSVTSVSKFGDEKTERWEAVVAVALRAKTKDKSRAEKTAYRFLQCGEMVEADVTRDRFGDHDNVFSAALHLHPTGPLAALSRWRDRAVGDFQAQLHAVGYELAKSGAVSALTAWSLTGFLGCRGSGPYAALCIRKAKTQAERQRIFNSAYDDFKLDSVRLKEWKELQTVAAEFGLTDRPLAEMITELESLVPPSPIRSDSAREASKAGAAKTHRELLRGMNVVEAKDLDTILSRLDKIDGSRELELLWNLIIESVPRGKEKSFLAALNQTFHVNYIHAGIAATAAWNAWNGRAAVRQEWASFMKALAKHHAIEFSNYYRLYAWQEMNPIHTESIPAFKAGLVEGFSECTEMMDASTFFGFARHAAEDLSPKEAYEVLDYALERFEKHMIDGSGDGPWDSWLKTPSAMPDAIGGLIWSALGSPHSVVRWQAAHCVRRLAANGCEAELRSLIGWLNRETVASFGGYRLPFYALHSRLYLMLAFSRIAYENPGSIRAFTKDFATAALEGLPHALIQKVAATTALALELAFPGIIDSKLKVKLQRVGTSPFAIVNRDPRAESPIARWHELNLTKGVGRLHFGIDFGPYWFKYLGNVFGLSEDQITDLVSNVAIEDLNVPTRDGYSRDPRAKQWNSVQSRRKGATHSHGSYPFIDDYTFYYAYHSLMSVGARLLKKMPTVRWYRDDVDPWPNWVNGHVLTRRDGRWLADRRDATPLKRRAWTLAKLTETWKWELKKEDFIDALWKQNKPLHPLCVYGSWSDEKDNYIERVRVCSALIDPAYSEAVAADLRSCDDHEQRPFPPNEGTSENWSKGPAKLTAWLYNGWLDPSIDGFDPIGRGIKYPPCRVDQKVAAQLDLRSDSEMRFWTQSNSTVVDLVDEIWSDENIEHEDIIYRAGERMNASASFLKRMCATLKKDLLIKVEITRTRHRRYRSSGDEDNGYVPSSHKVFVFSKDGKLKDAASIFEISA